MSKMGVATFGVAVAALLGGTAASAQQIKHAWWETKGVQGATFQIPGDLTDAGTRLTPQLNGFGPGSPVFIGFEGSTQFDNAMLARNFIRLRRNRRLIDHGHGRRHPICRHDERLVQRL